MSTLRASNANTRPSRPPRVPPVPGAASTRQQSSQRSENYSNIVATTSASNIVTRSDSEVSVESIATSDVTYDEYIQLGVRGLKGCQLTLADTNLTIKWKVPDNLQDKGETTVDLDIHIANINGMLVWGRGGGGFSKTCKDGSTRLNGTVLIASCFISAGGSGGGGGGGYTDAQLDLNDYFAFSRNGFQPNIPDPEFDKFISAASWMNFTIVLPGQHEHVPPESSVQNAVSSVARRAVEVSNLQTFAVVQQMVKKLETINKNSEEYIASQMAAFVRSAAESAAAFAAMGQLTMMMGEQRTAYDTFHSSIYGTPPMPPQNPGQAHCKSEIENRSRNATQNANLNASRDAAARGNREDGPSRGQGEIRQRGWFGHAENVTTDVGAQRLDTAPGGGGAAASDEGSAREQIDMLVTRINALEQSSDAGWGRVIGDEPPPEHQEEPPLRIASSSKLARNGLHFHYLHFLPSNVAV
ncbi:hypothetical protein B0H14DRAFT_2574662 [Mycena olivaceomarginata]|nr:hypothetical protein B0H14DRAFT_2574662 [Mycena olivaceomarginata]